MAIRMSNEGTVSKHRMSNHVSRMSGFRVGMVGRGLGALNPGSLPLNKNPGEYLRVTDVQYNWVGPATLFWVLIGLKKGSGDFNDGANLADGKYTVSAFTTPSRGTVGVVQQTLSTPVALLIESAWAGRTFDAYIWVVDSALTTLYGAAAFLDDSGFTLIDTDVGVLRVVSGAALSGFDAKWA